MIFNILWKYSTHIPNINLQPPFNSKSQTSHFCTKLWSKTVMSSETVQSMSWIVMSYTVSPSRHLDSQWYVSSSIMCHIAITNCPFRFALVTYLDVGNFCDKRTEKIYMKFVCKLPTYFDDVTTIEMTSHNRKQVRVNIDAMLVAIFRIQQTRRGLWRVTVLILEYIVIWETGKLWTQIYHHKSRSILSYDNVCNVTLQTVSSSLTITLLITLSEL